MNAVIRRVQDVKPGDVMVYSHVDDVHRPHTVHSVRDVAGAGWEIVFTDGWRVQYADVCRLTLHNPEEVLPVASTGV